MVERALWKEPPPPPQALSLIAQAWHTTTTHLNIFLISIHSLRSSNYYGFHINKYHKYISAHFSYEPRPIHPSLSCCYCLFVFNCMVTRNRLLFFFLVTHSRMWSTAADGIEILVIVWQLSVTDDSTHRPGCSSFYEQFSWQACREEVSNMDT